MTEKSHTDTAAQGARDTRAIGEVIVADVEQLLAMEAAFLVSLAENGLPADMGELLVRGDAMHGIPPRLGQKAIKAALAAQPPAALVGTDHEPLLKKLRFTRDVMKRARMDGKSCLMSIWEQDLDGIEEAIKILSSDGEPSNGKQPLMASRPAPPVPSEAPQSSADSGEVK